MCMYIFPLYNRPHSSPEVLQSTRLPSSQSSPPVQLVTIMVTAEDGVGLVTVVMELSLNNFLILYSPPYSDEYLMGLSLISLFWCNTAVKKCKLFNYHN